MIRAELLPRALRRKPPNAVLNVALHSMPHRRQPPKLLVDHTEEGEKRSLSILVANGSLVVLLEVNLVHGHALATDNVTAIVGLDFQIHFANLAELGVCSEEIGREQRVLQLPAAHFAVHKQVCNHYEDIIPHPQEKSSPFDVFVWIAPNPPRQDLSCPAGIRPRGAFIYDRFAYFS